MQTDQLEDSREKMTSPSASKQLEAVIAEESTTLYFTIDECYVYQNPGRDNGLPINDSDILYDTEQDEVLELDLKNRSGKYVAIIQPVPGYVFLPEELEDKKYESGLRSVGITETADNDEDKKVSNDPDDGPVTLQDEEQLDGKVDFGNEEEERRDYSAQRMMKLEKDPDFPDEEEKMWVKIPWLDRNLKKLVFLFRQNSFLPGLIIFIIQLVIESFILFDVYTDGVVVYNLYIDVDKIVDENPVKARRIQFWFMFTCVFLAAPYLIAWSAVTQMAGKKLREQSDSCLWKIFVVFFDVAPIGALMLFLNDFVHWGEAFVKPFWQICTRGKPWIRVISFEELGYYKLRRVSEIFAESICQTAVQAYLLASTLYPGEVFGILASIASSAIVTCLWSTIIFLEGKKNGMSFTEYTTVILQGSFNFVPMLPAIERGNPNGEKVNWTYYKISTDGVGHVGKALLNRNCRLNTVKVSSYTFATLHRFGAKYFGSMIKTSPQEVTVFVSRLEEEVRQLFTRFDTDNDESFDFWEFTRVSLALKQSVKERLIRADVNDVFLELADSIRRKVWLLDLVIKIRGSTARVALLDFDQPLDYALSGFNFKMMSFLMAVGYDEVDDYNKREFQLCCTRAITYDPDMPGHRDNGLTAEEKKQKVEANIAAAMCLCEDKGVPIVVRIVSADDLLPMDDDGKSDPYVKVDCLGIEENSSIKKQTLNPVWEEDLLFILPFESAQKLLEASKLGTVSENAVSAEPLAAAKSMGSSDNMLKTQIPSIASLPSYIQNYRINESSFQVTNKTRLEDEEASKLGAGYNDMNKQQSDSVQQVELVESPRRADSGGDLASRYKQRALSNAKLGVAGLPKNNSKLVLKFKVHDYDAGGEDDYMGSFKIKVDLKDDTSKYHQEEKVVQIGHFQHPPGKAGKLRYRIYLNVLQYYQDNGIGFIDKISGNAKSLSNDDALFEQMEKRQNGQNDQEQITFTV